jgi:hypothetical protein
MKKLTITLVVALIFCAQFANAQVNTTSAKSAATDASSSFDAVASAIKSLKEKAAAEFSTEQSAIDSEKTRLVGVRADIEKGNAAEKDMMANQWPARVAARQKLVQEEQAVTLRAQKLNNRKKAFEHKAAQLEQRANAAIAMESEHLTGRNQVMNSFAGAINATEY